MIKARGWLPVADMGPALAIFLASVAAAAEAAGWSAHERWMMDNPLDSISLQSSGLQDSYPKPRFVTQRQDHFDKFNVKTWQQAYYVNDTFWTPGSNAPVFLCVGGEGPPLDGSAVTHSLHCNAAVEWLSEKKALMFALEHRYYGCHNASACPVPDFGNVTASLKYLSSHQAVEDVADFVRQMNDLYKLGQDNKWVTWGGSYPGMLAGFSRLKHPELIHAAVASSAPVHAKLDMFEYNDAVANAYSVSDNEVGGSPECRNAIREAHAVLEKMLLSKSGIYAAERALGLDRGSLATKDSQRDILGQGAAYFPAQGNEPSCTSPGCNIKKICEVMLDRSIGDELARLSAVRNAQQEALRSQQRGLEDLPDFWYYQTCTEFGFYQTCAHNSSCMFVRGLVDVESMADGCKDFGITIPDIENNIVATNSHYGGLRPTGQSGQLGSCVLWPNGEVDPWATLSVLKQPAPLQPVLWVPGASHHAWTHPSTSSDQASVVSARAAIYKQVDEFLVQSCAQTESLNVVV